MSKIKVMSEQLSNRIAAGEVIDRPGRPADRRGSSSGRTPQMTDKGEKFHG